MQLPERTERSVSYTRYQLLVACVVNLVKVNLFFTQYCRNICFRNICLDVYRHNQLMPWQRINKLTEVESRTQGSRPRPRPRTQKNSEAKAKAKDSLFEDRTSRGQGQECSRPRPRTKDTGASVLRKKKS